MKAGECSCWHDYPNECHKKRSGKWKCVDDYECVRPLERKVCGTVEMPAHKTVCRRKQANNECGG